MKYFSNKVLDKKIKEEGGGGGETYTADEETLHLDENNEFSISSSYRSQISNGQSAYGTLNDWFEEINYGTEQNPAWVLVLKKKEGSLPRAFLSYGDQIVGAGTPGGGGGGVDSLYKLNDVYGNPTTEKVKTATGEDVSNGQALVWNESLGMWVAGTVQSGGGSVTSVGLSMPTGFSVSGSPVTSSGTLAVSFANGYSLPTTDNQTAWSNKYDKPSGGIPKTDLASGVQTSLGLADSAYQKPSGGIPNSDLANSWVKVGTTQISLGGQQTSLSGLVNVTMSGKLTIGGAEIEWVAPVGTTPGYLKINSALLTEGDQIVVSGTPGGGGGGGSQYLTDLLDVYPSTKPSVQKILVFDPEQTDKDGNPGAWVYADMPTGSITSVSLAQGATNGTLHLVVNGTAQSDVAVTGLGSLAYKSSLAASDIPDLSATYQPLDADLTAIAWLTGTSGVLKKTAADTWALDANIETNASNGNTAYNYFSNEVLPYNHGGTGFSTYTKGDLLYASANNTLSKLAANSTGTKKFLTMTSSVPSWGNIAFGDLPTLYWANVAVSSSSSTTTEPTVKSITIGGATLTWVAPVGTTPGYLKINSALLTDGDQIVGGGTPGGGGGGGASYLSDLLDVKYGLNPSADDLLIYSSSVPLNPDGTVTGPGWTTIAKSSVGKIYSAGTGLNISDSNVIGIASGYKLPTTTEWGNKADASALGNYVTLASDESITGKKTFSLEKWLVSGNESNQIEDKGWGNGTYYKTDDSAVVGTTYAIRHALRFRWYDEYYDIGAIRDGSTGTIGFGIGKENSGNTHILDLFRVSTSGAWVIGNTVYHSGNLTPGNFVTSVDAGDSNHPYNLAITKGSGTSYITVPFATETNRFRSYSASSSGLDLNTKLTGGAVAYNYGSGNYWQNGPTGMTYGGALQINSNSSFDTLAMQLAWDIEHNVADGTKSLWWRDRNNLGWGGWRLIYHSGNANKSDVDWTAQNLTAYYAHLGSGNSVTNLELFGSGTGAAIGFYKSGTRVSLLYSSGDVPFMRYNGDWTVGYKIYDESNLTKSVLTGLLDANGGYYLPLTGGTLTNANMGDALEVKRNNQNYASCIKFSNASDGVLGYIGMTGSVDSGGIRPVYYTGANTYGLYHSGNSNKSDVAWACSNLTATASAGWAGVFTSTNNAAYLSNANANSGPLYLGSKANTSSGYLIRVYYNQTTLGSGGTCAFAVRADGNVGIGTTSPLCKFEVSGTSGWATRIISTNSSVYAAHNDGYGFYVGTKATSTYYLLNLCYGETSNGSGGTSALYVRADGKVGIGTGSPDSLLYVNGLTKIIEPTNARFSITMNSPNITLSNISSAYSSGGWTAGLNAGTDGTSAGCIAGVYMTGSTIQRYWYGGTSYSSPLMVILPGGNVGIGTTSPEYPLQVAGTIYSNGGVMRVDSGYSFGALYSGSHYDLAGMDASGNNMFGRGNVSAGIRPTQIFGNGITFYNNSVTQIASLDTSGDFSNTGSIYTNRIFLRRSSNAYYGRIGFYSSAYTTWYIYMTNAGAVSPTGANAPQGSVVKTWALRSLIENSANYGWTWESCPNGSNQTPVIQMELSSNTGTLVTRGDQVISSDINLKTHLEPVKYTIEDIAKTRAVTFDWKDGRGKSAGSIAQDWKPLIPELVHGEEGNMTLAYGQIALVNSILLAKHETEQDKEIKKLKARVRELEKQLKMRS